MINSFEGSIGFLQLLDALSDLVLVKGPESKLLWANKAFQEFYGMTNDQLRGIIDSPNSKPDYTKKFVQDDAWVFANGKVLDIPQEPVARFDGVIRIFHTIKSPIFDSQGKVSMTVGISRDLTDQLEAAKSLDEQRAKLEYSSKMATLGEMAGGIAHEINTPLAAIKMMSSQVCEILMDELPDLEQIQVNAERIELTINKISKIIDGLKKFSRDGSRDKFVKVELQKLIDETLIFCQEKIQNKGIDLKVLIEGDQIFLDCSPSQMSQVILNLVNNAIDATGVLSKKRKIVVESKQTNGSIFISVSDNGPGIESSIKEKIFRPFFTTKDIGQGTGLGLSISKGIVNSHGGNLFLDENSPETKFTIQIPQT